MIWPHSRLSRAVEWRVPIKKSISINKSTQDSYSPTLGLWTHAEKLLGTSLKHSRAKNTPMQNKPIKTPIQSNAITTYIAAHTLLPHYKPHPHIPKPLPRTAPHNLHAHTQQLRYPAPNNPSLSKLNPLSPRMEWQFQSRQSRNLRYWKSRPRTVYLGRSVFCVLEWCYVFRR